MSFIEIMHTYFRGEKLEAFWFVFPVGILLFVFGIAALKTERGGFAERRAEPYTVALEQIAVTQSKLPDNE